MRKKLKRFFNEESYSQLQNVTKKKRKSRGLEETYTTLLTFR
jgi:hypothetical protein